MKKPIYLLLPALFLIFAQSLEAQETPSPHGASAKILFLDHGNVNGIDSLTITNGLELAYVRDLNPSVKLAIPLKIAVADIAGDINRRTLVSLDASLQFPFAKKLELIQPYLFGGAGFVVEDFDESNLQFPVGLGANFALGGKNYLTFQAEYRKSTVENRDNLQFGIGYLFGVIRKPMEELPPDRDGDKVPDKTDKCPDTPGNITAMGCPDGDGDGVTDENDNCPDEPGPASANGCPDRDQDGVADKYDECPDEKGLAKNNGCPTIDSDGDGVNDDLDLCPDTPGPIVLDGCPDSDGDGVADKYDECPDEVGKKNTSGCPDQDLDGIADKYDNCPTLAGPPERKGCPSSDLDRDGIPDARDKCPETAGPPENDGCPEIQQEVRDILALAMTNVQFQTGQDELLGSSYKVLDQIVGVMNRYPEYNLMITGHTDNVGTEANNQDLSERRAKTCYDYLVRKGISTDRLKYSGKGETEPIAPNSTAEGRTMNRRVEFELEIK